MKTSIQIKSIFGKIIFEFQKENNSIKETAERAVFEGADLLGADLRGADLRGANLRGANLRCANLRCAYLVGADLVGAYLVGNVKILCCKNFTGIYKYVVIPYITIENIKMIKMGCFNRSLEDWQNYFWNNDKEFPNNNSLLSNERIIAFNTAKAWLEFAEIDIKNYPKKYEL